MKNLGIIAYIFITKSYKRFRKWVHNKLTKGNKKQANRHKRRKARMQQLPRSQNEQPEIGDSGSRLITINKSENQMSRVIAVKNTISNTRRQKRGQAQSLRQLTSSIKVSYIIISL